MMDNSTFRATGDAIDGGRGRGRESLIDQECFFEGTFRTPGNMRIEGTYQGAIECQGTLLIAESGQVNARIVAGNLIVAGQFSGEVQCDSRFELLKTGRVSGAVAAQSTVVHDGAFFEGEIRMGGREMSSPQPQPASAPVMTGPGAVQAPRVPPAGVGRRRAGIEAAGDGGAAAPEPPAPDEPAPDQTPRVNGRSQGAAARDIVPNRTAEA